MCFHVLPKTGWFDSPEFPVLVLPRNQHHLWPGTSWDHWWANIICGLFFDDFSSDSIHVGIMFQTPKNRPSIRTYSEMISRCSPKWCGWVHPALHISDHAAPTPVASSQPKVVLGATGAGRGGTCEQGAVCSMECSLRWLRFLYGVFKLLGTNPTLMWLCVFSMVLSSTLLGTKPYRTKTCQDHIMLRIFMYKITICAVEEFMLIG